MLDPFTALSLASSIFQFAELGYKVTNRALEMWHNECETRDIKLYDSTVQDFNRFVKGLNAPLPKYQQTEAERNIARLAEKCKGDVEKLRILLESLKPERFTPMQSMWSSVKTQWNQKEISELHKRLEGYRSAISFNLLDLLNCNTTGLLKTLTDSKAETTGKLEIMKNTMDELKNMLASYTSSNTRAAAMSTTTIPEMLDRMTDGGNNAIYMIRRSLSLNSPYRREENIMPAHQKTLEWLFSPDHKFLRWLSDPSATLFWVARFYFWGGNPQQSTLEGLLRSLLHEITRQCPQLISVIAPERWKSVFSEDIKRQWTMYEVERSLERFIKQETVSCRAAVFIDGLDEFTGDQDKLQELLDKLRASNKIKLCLASRPLNRFEEAYGRSEETMLRVHELTKTDIVRYASDLLEKRINLGGGSSARGDDTKNKLMREIVERAEGVFLWVNLVVHSLSEGLTNADTIDTLRDRLDEIPRDLELLFKRILDSIDKNYWKESSMIFQMATTAKFALPAGVYSVVYEHEDDYCLRDDLQPMNTRQYEKAIRMLKLRLAARTKGLLEIGATPKVQPDDYDFYAPHVVIFLHRTVKDFLSAGKIEELLRSRLHGPFDPDFALCRGLLVQLKRFTAKPEHNHYSSFQKALNDLMFHAKQFEVKNNDTPTRILDQAAALGDEKLFYRAAIQHDLCIYLENRLQKGCKLPPRIAGQQTLLIALVPNNDRYECASSPRLIQLLLEYGADPNKLVTQRETMTVWEDAVKRMLSVDQPPDPRSDDDMFEIFQIMLHWKGRYPDLANDIELRFGDKQSRLLSNLMRELDAPDESPLETIGR
ncbi:hypothetical protein LQW54_010810 [Pestalotiopsis sp. IQ-011]